MPFVAAALVMIGLATAQLVVPPLGVTNGATAADVQQISDANPCGLINVASTIDVSQATPISGKSSVTFIADNFVTYAHIALSLCTMV